MLLYYIGLVSSARYAFLYAGSNQFYNYRHQADIFTIYNQLLNRGFTQQNIALYAYVGQVFHSIDHKTNVYPGSSAVNVKGDDVTANSFHSEIINLPTTSEDYVFIYYDNHGGTGILGTPVGHSIFWDDLAVSFNKAESSKLYKKCLFVIEACYSGSVAQHFNSTNLATITAANDQESSYAAIYDPKLGTYISNEFTSHFIDLIDLKPSITVGELFETLQKETEQSHACFFGDETIKELPLSYFIGTPNRKLPHKIVNHNSTPVTQREASEKTLRFLAYHEKASIRAWARLEMLKRKAMTERLETVLELIAQYVEPKDFNRYLVETSSKITKNYSDVLRVFMERFGEVNPDDYGRFTVLKELAADHSKAEIIQAIFAVI